MNSEHLTVPVLDKITFLFDTSPSMLLRTICVSGFVWDYVTIMVLLYLSFGLIVHRTNDRIIQFDMDKEKLHLTLISIQ